MRAMKPIGNKRNSDLPDFEGNKTTQAPGRASRRVPKLAQKIIRSLRKVAELEPGAPDCGPKRPRARSGKNKGG